MSLKIVRESKYRHVWGTELKQDFHYRELRPKITAWDIDYLKASTEFFAFPQQGGGGNKTI
jgi:coronin-1B/1C/6